MAAGRENMIFETRIVNPLEVPSWDSLIAKFPEATIFNTTGWARALSASYGYDPQYITLWSESELLAALPLMEVNSFLTGRRGVSLPFSDVCPLLTRHNISKADIVKTLLAHARSRGWKSIETRGGINAVAEGEEHSYLVHLLDLTAGEEDILKNTRSSTRRNIRKAEKEGVVVVEDNSSGGLSEFCRLNLITRRQHGVPPQPGFFFRILYENVIAAGHGCILLAKYENKVVAAAVFMTFNGNAIYKYGASDKEYQWLRANNLVMWEAIRKFTARGDRTFHFGRTEPDHKGLLQFKRGWGTEEKGLDYLVMDFQKDAWERKTTSHGGLHTYLFSMMPPFMLKAVGRVLYRHMG